MKNDPKEGRAAGTLFSTGWTVKAVAEKLDVTRRSIEIAFSTPAMIHMRRKIENLVGHPLFSTPLEFERRQKTIRFLGADVESLRCYELVVIAKKVGIKPTVNAHKADLLKALNDYEIANNPELNRRVALKLVDHANGQAAATSQAIQNVIAQTAAAGSVIKHIANQIDVAADTAKTVQN